MWVIWVLIIWSAPWKAIALWRAARRGSRGWFATLFLINTMGILEILYIFHFSAKKKEELPAPTDLPGVPQSPLDIKKII